MIQLQELISTLPKPLKRMRAAWMVARWFGTPYHRVVIPSGSLIGNIQDAAVCNALVQGRFEDYGYYGLAGDLMPAQGVHVDVGANYGFHTFGLFDGTFAMGTQFLLIDANPDCAHCHRLSADLHPKHSITPIHCALGDHSGEVLLTYESSNTGQGYIQNADPSEGQQVRVPLRKLDDVLRENKIVNVDLLKADIEGSEVAALRGATDYLSRGAIRNVYIEVNNLALVRQQTSPEALFELLGQNSYKLFWPHESMDWILSQYGNPDVRSEHIKRFDYKATRTRRLAEFDRSLFAAPIQQFDLLAIHTSAL